jgi:hypothetical protein
MQFVAPGFVEAARSLGGQFFRRQFKLIRYKKPTAELGNQVESQWK